MRNSSKKILYCAKGWFHPTVWGQNALSRILEQVPDTSITTISRLNFSKAIPEHEPDLIVLYFHEKKIRQQDLEALIHYVDEGGGILAIHSASASFKQEPAYHQLLGGRFIEHGRIQPYQIEAAIEHVANSSPLILNDELYLHEYSEDNSIWLQTSLEGTIEPIAWTKQQGKGKVAYFAPGHRASIFQNDTVKIIIHQLIQWSLIND